MKKGFTLLELLIVIVVIGILAGVSVPRLMSFIDEGKKGATTSEMAAIKSASRLFFMHTGRYMKTVSELVENKEGGTGDKIPRWNGPYVEDDLEEVAYDAWGNEYIIIDKQIDPETEAPKSGTITITKNGQKQENLCGILLISKGANGQDDGNSSNYSDESDDIFEWLKYDGVAGASAE